MDSEDPALTPEAVLDRVRAFCGSLQGELGPFRLIHSGSALTLLPRRIEGDMRPRVTPMDGGRFAVSGFMAYADNLYQVELEATSDGRVTMTRAEPVGTVRFGPSGA